MFIDPYKEWEVISRRETTVLVCEKGGSANVLQHNKFGLIEKVLFE